MLAIKKAESVLTEARRKHEEKFAQIEKDREEQRREVDIAGVTAPRRTRPFFGALTLNKNPNGWGK